MNAGAFFLFGSECLVGWTDVFPPQPDLSLSLREGGVGVRHHGRGARRGAVGLEGVSSATFRHRGVYSEGGCIMVEMIDNCAADRCQSRPMVVEGSLEVFFMFCRAFAC